jgi:hypothetical protein
MRVNFGAGIVVLAIACYFWRPAATRSLINVAAGFMALAIACLLLLPSRVALAFNSGGIARALGIFKGILVLKRG